MSRTCMQLMWVIVTLSLIYSVHGCFNLFKELVTSQRPQTNPFFTHCAGVFTVVEQSFVVEDTTSFLANYDKSFRDGGLSDVVQAYEHALLARYPRARYLVGQDAVYKARWAAMPEWYSDWKLDSKGKPVPAACR